MQFLIAIAFLSAVTANPFAKRSRNAAKENLVGSLMQHAVETENSQLRRLDQDEYEVDISGYFVKFEQCQFVKAYDEELAEDKDSTSVLATKRFVIFRLCPNDCDSCNYGYGEYLVDLETYLENTVNFFQNYQEEMCNACNECGNNDDQAQQGDDAQNNGGRRLDYYNVDCDSCYDECYKIENMEANGYVDATEFLECQMIYDPEDDGYSALYAGPICASSGTKVKIGVFSDEDCLTLDASKDVDDYLQGDNGQMKLSHALLKSTYTNTCISCLEPQDEDDNNQGNDNEDEDKVIEMCEQLYDASAKCESSHGFDDGYAQYDNYENQANQESTVCEFMQSLRSGTYDEEGEIIVSGASSTTGSNSTTGGQKFALTFFILGTVGLAVYAAMLHSKLTKGGKTELTGSGGAMA